MDQPILEAETVDEGLQRRARRADGAGEIDLACAALVEIIRRSDPGEHLAARIVDDHDGDRHVRPKRAGAVEREALQSLLQGAVDGEADLARIRRAGNGVVSGMRRDHRHFLACMRHRLELGARDLV